MGFVTEIVKIHIDNGAYHIVCYTDINRQVEEIHVPFLLGSCSQSVADAALLILFAYEIPCKIPKGV